MRGLQLYQTDRQAKASVQGMHTGLRIMKKRRIASPHRSAKGPWRANQPARFALTE